MPYSSRKSWETIQAQDFSWPNKPIGHRVVSAVGIDARLKPGPTVHQFHEWITGDDLTYHGVLATKITIEEAGEITDVVIGSEDADIDISCSHKTPDTGLAVIHFLAGICRPCLLAITPFDQIEKVARHVLVDNRFAADAGVWAPAVCNAHAENNFVRPGGISDHHRHGIKMVK